MRDLDRRTGGKITVWEEAGLLTVTEGNVIDYEAIKVAMRADAEVYQIEEIAFDRWGATQLSSELIEEGFPLVQVGQGYATMAATDAGAAAPRRGGDLPARGQPPGPLAGR